jgi:hypothetical protein
MTTARVVLRFGVSGCLLITACDGVVPGSQRQVDPKLVSEARSASPECQFPAWMREEKEFYTTEELDQRSAAARACHEAVWKYLRTHHKGKY